MKTFVSMKTFVCFLCISCGVFATVLTAQAERDLFEPIFNGKSLNGWKVIDGAEYSWRCVDGLIYCTGEKGGGWLSTTREYANFELKFDFRLRVGGNSGVFLRSPHEGNPAFVGMEIQLLDDGDPQYANLKPTQYTGSLYDVVPANPRVSKPAGEWQHMEILCDNRHVRVTLNGTVVVDADLDKYQSDFEKHPGLKRTSGYLGFQNHGTRVDLANLYVRELP